MKKILIFIAGGIVGALIALAIPYLRNEKLDYYQNSITLFKQVGECVSTSNFKILQVTDEGALALEVIDTGIEKLDVPSGLVVFFKDDTGISYYDGQLIKMTKGMCAKQIGVYRYLTAEESELVFAESRIIYTNCCMYVV